MNTDVAGEVGAAEAAERRTPLRFDVPIVDGRLPDGSGIRRRVHGDARQGSAARLTDRTGDRAGRCSDRPRVAGAPLVGGDGGADRGDV